MNQAFADSVGRVIDEMLGFRGRLVGGAVPGIREVRDRFIGLVDEFAGSARKQAGREEDYDLARCALVCWIDEMLTLHVGWKHAEEFRENCLELHYPELQRLKGRPPSARSRDVEGPYLFFEMAEVAKTREETDALETFLLCVALGFRGRFDFHDEGLEAWSAQAFALIDPRLRRKVEADRLRVGDRSSWAGPLRPLPGQPRLLAVHVLAAASAIASLIAFLVAVHTRPY